MILRLATMKDVDFLLECRNDPETRSWSRTRDEITPEEHLDYVRETTDLILIAEVANKVKVGQVRFVRHPHELELGIIVHPGHRGKGYSVQMLELAKAQAFRPIVAYVREGNEKSYRAFVSAGFKQDDTYVRFTWEGDK